MSEINSGQQEAVIQLSLLDRTRRVTAIAIAGILSISSPVILEQAGEWEETTTVEYVIPGGTSLETFPTSKTEIRDETGREIPRDELNSYLKYNVTEKDEKKEFVNAIEEIVLPDSKVRVTRDGDDVLIQTGDFADHPELKPRDKQAQTLEIGIDGELVHGEGQGSRRTITPEIVVKEDVTEEHSLTVPVYFYPEAVMPEKPEIVSEGEEGDNDPDPLTPEDNDPQTKPEPINQPTEPKTEEEAATEEPEPTPPKEPAGGKPEKPGKSGNGSTGEPEPTPPKEPAGGKPEKPGKGANGSMDNTQSENRVRTVEEILDEHISQTTKPRGANVRATSVKTGSGGRGQRSFNFSPKFPRIRGLLVPIIAGSIIGGGLFALRESEFESVEDCALGTPEQPLNIEKESGEWLPSFSQPDCPEPIGHEVRVTFEGFSNGYGIGSLSEDGDISEVISVPKSAMPGFIIDRYAGDKFTSQVRGLMNEVDQAREQIAEQTGRQYKPFN